MGTSWTNIFLMSNSVLYCNKLYFPKMSRVFLLNLRILVPPKINNNNNNISFGSHGHARKSQNHENEEFPSVPKMKSNTYSSQMKRRMIIRSFWAILFHIFTVKMAHKWPKHASIFFPWFSHDFLRVSTDHPYVSIDTGAAIRKDEIRIPSTYFGSSTPSIGELLALIG